MKKILPAACRRFWRASTEQAAFGGRRALSEAGRNGRNPVIRVSGGEILAAWIETGAAETPGVWTQRFDAAGAALDQPRFAAPASRETWNLNAAIDDEGVFYVIYDAVLGTHAKELQLIEVGRGRIVRHPLSADDGYESVYPDIAVSGDRVAVSWADRRDGNEEVYLFVGSRADLSASVDRRAMRITHTPGESNSAYLAWNADRLALAWNEKTGGSVDVIVRTFDSRGRPAGASRRLTQGGAQALLPAIRPWHGGFAVAWSDYVAVEDGSKHGSVRSSDAVLEEIR